MGNSEQDFTVPEEHLELVSVANGFALRVPEEIAALDPDGVCPMTGDVLKLPGFDDEAGAE